MNCISISSQIDNLLLNPEIYKYNMELYRYYFAIHSVKEILENAAGGENIAVYGGYALSHIWEKISPALKDKVQYIIEEELAGNQDSCGLQRPCITPDEVDSHGIDIVILTTYKNRKKVRDKIVNPQIQVIDLYEILYQKKINMEEEFYQGVHYSYGYIIQDLYTLKNCSEKLRVILLKKLIGEYFHIRDYENAFETIRLLSEFSQETIFYENLKQEIQECLFLLQKRVSSKQHILVNWLDAVPPEAAEQMPYIKSEIQKGIYFENAHTVVKHTKPTMKTIFTGENYIDDQLFLMKMDDLEDSHLYQNLKKNGYRFKYFGGYMRYGIFQNGRTIPYINSTDHFLLACMPLQWAVVKELEECTEKSFILIHNLVEGHEFLNGDRNLPEEEMISDLQERRKIHKNTSYHYLDRQLKFYMPLYQNLEYQILMSDHGVNDGTVPDDWREFTHILLSILGEDVKAEKVESMASLISFPNMIDCLMRKESSKIAQMVSTDYVLVQTEDMYNMHAMEAIYTDICRFEDSYMQRRGVITLKDCFYRKATGEEFYFLKGGTENQIDRPECQKRINELRKTAGNQFIDIGKYEKYFGSKRMYELLGYRTADDIELL